MTAVPVPATFWVASAAALGAVIGSFLNVCIYRVPRRCMTVAYPRHSRCPKCGHDIRWFENIPVLSWLCLLGKCAGCRSPISAIYPFVEALTAGAFALCAWFALESPASWLHGVMGPWAGTEPEVWMRGVWFGIAALVTASLIVATFVDFEFQILPDQITIGGAILAPILSMAFPWLHRPILRLRPEAEVPSLVAPSMICLEALFASVLGAVVGAGSIWLVGVIGKAVFRKDAMGLGDVKLMAAVGGLLGWKAALLVFMIGCCAGSVIGIGQMVLFRVLNLLRKTPGKFDHYLAFGPYLALGALAMFFMYADVDEFIFVQYPRLIQRLADVAFTR